MNTLTQSGISRRLVLGARFDKTAHIGHLLNSTLSLWTPKSGDLAAITLVSHRLILSNRTPDNGGSREIIRR